MEQSVCHMVSKGTFDTHIIIYNKMMIYVEANAFNIGDDGDKDSVER